MSLLDRQSTGFIGHFFRAYPKQSFLMVGLLLFAGLAEAVGVITLLPVLEIAVGGAAEDSLLTTTVRGFLDVVGLPATLPVLLSLVVVAMAMKGIFRWLAMRQVGYTVAAVAADLRLRLIRALMAARWQFFADQPVGQFANAVGTEAHRASDAYQQACAAMAGVVQVIVYAAIIVLVSWKVAVIAVLVGIFTTFLFSGLIHISREAGGDQTRVMKSLISSLSDALQGIKPVKAMGREGQVYPLLEEETRRLEEAQKRQVFAVEALLSFQEPVLAFMIAGGLYAAITWGEQSFAALIVMIFLFYRIVGRFNYLQKQYQTMTRGESAFWSIYEQSSSAEAQQERREGGQTPPTLSRELTFDSVSFSYDDGTEVLRDASLSVPAGSMVSIVGPSGAGKTTIVDLAIGLHEPDEGRILVDGVPLSQIDLQAWRRQVGYVPQDTVLLHASVVDNVTLGDERLTEDDVRRSLEAAGAWDFVSRLPSGLHTVVGERGVKISGGQRQRIAIARALVQNPKLLILDEATTGLDDETEASVRGSLAGLRGDVTLISISHQGLLRDLADRAYEIRGRTVELVQDEQSSAPMASSR